MRDEIKNSEIRQLNGAIEHKIALANHLQASYGQALLRDEKIQMLLLRLDQSIEATWRKMNSIGVVTECTNCALNGGGSCCGAGIEDMYNSVLLLINLLLGKDLPSRREEPSSCYFLTRQGCALRAREVICVNYFCRRIYRNIQQERLICLQKVEGEELNILFILQEYIKKKIA